MDFKKISDEAYLEWFNKFAGKTVREYSYEGLPTNPDVEWSPTMFVQQFAMDISLFTIRKYHEELTKKLKEHGIDLESDGIDSN